MALSFVTAYAGAPHVMSYESAQLNAATFGHGTYACAGIGDECSAYMANSNTLHVNSGAMMIQGRFVVIDDEGFDFEVTSGTQGQHRIDVCCAHYTKGDDGVEKLEPLTMRGEPTTGEPVAPTVPECVLWEEATSEGLVPLFTVRITNTQAADPVPLFDVQPCLVDMADLLAKKKHTHSASDITSGVMPISCGGTEASTTTKARVNLLADTAESETNADDTSLFLMIAASRQGVVVRKGSYIWEWLKSKIGFNSAGVMPISRGGTQAAARGGAMDNLTKLGTNVIPNNAADTLANWRNAGFGVGWFSESKLEGQPYATGSIINMPQPGLSVVNQLWHSGTGGSWYHRGFDADGVLPWHMFLDNANTAARVTSRGQSGNWYWQVYSDKFCIATYLMSYSKTCLTAWGNGYYNTAKCGGADYPTAIKWKAAPRVETVISSPDGRLLATHCNDGTETKAPTAYLCSFAQYTQTQTCRMVQLCMGWVE